MAAVSLTGTCVDINLDSFLDILYWLILNIIGNKALKKGKVLTVYRRVEPDVDYYCDIDYDVFQMMKDNGFKYGMCFDGIKTDH